MKLESLCWYQCLEEGWNLHDLDLGLCRTGLISMCNSSWLQAGKTAQLRQSWEPPGPRAFSLFLFRYQTGVLDSSLFILKEELWTTNRKCFLTWRAGLVFQTGCVWALKEAVLLGTTHSWPFLGSPHTYPQSLLSQLCSLVQGGTWLLAVLGDTLVITICCFCCTRHLPPGLCVPCSTVLLSQSLLCVPVVAGCVSVRLSHTGGWQDAW